MQFFYRLLFRFHGVLDEVKGFVVLFLRLVHKGKGRFGSCRVLHHMTRHCHKGGSTLLLHRHLHLRHLHLLLHHHLLVHHCLHLFGRHRHHFCLGAGRSSVFQRIKRVCRWRRGVGGSRSGGWGPRSCVHETKGRTSCCGWSCDSWCRF